MTENFFPKTWSDFLRLRARREALWQKVPRAEYTAHPARRQRRIFVDAGAGAYYLVTCIPTDGTPGFFRHCRRHLQHEQDCYAHAGALGFGVPDRVHLIINATAATVFEAVLIVSAVQGKSIADLQAAGQLPPDLLHEAFAQAVILGLIFADRDRGNTANLLVRDDGVIAHIDFEEAGRATCDALLAQLRANYDLEVMAGDRDYVMLRLRDLKGKLVESYKEIGQAACRLYARRIHKGLAALKGNCLR